MSNSCSPNWMYNFIMCKIKHHTDGESPQYWCLRPFVCVDVCHCHSLQKCPVVCVKVSLWKHNSMQKMRMTWACALVFHANQPADAATHCFVILNREASMSASDPVPTYFFKTVILLLPIFCLCIKGYAS